MQVKASVLVALLQDHIEKHGDDKVMIYDEYAGIYKSFGLNRISRNGSHFIVECDQSGSITVMED